MNQKRNYQKEMEKVIDGFGGEKKKLLLHSCCAPCNSAVLEKLQEIFDLTVFFYNPNITEKAEYERRIGEQRRLVEYFNEKNPQFPIKLIEGNYEPAKFLQMSKGLEKAPEGGERCYGCYGLRLEESARVAKEQGFDYFTTSLTISPMKNAEKLNTLGEQMAEKYGVSFLPSDFKKKEGYKRSIELSGELDLYRQDYCGCGFSKAESILRKQEKEQENSLTEEKRIGSQM